MLVHIREHYALSNGSYGRPRMTMELREAGLDVGERRVGRLMKDNGIRPVRTRRHKVTTDSYHQSDIVANLLDGDFLAEGPNQKWAGDIRYIWTGEGWLWRQNWPTRRQATAAIFQHINGFYNPRRRHSYLGGISPLAFEARVP
ncbi:Mobile element protein [Acetobacter tropicalis]|uniref:Mobile element protein n=1 Tax=Acetobacter tropicalis TaxID=104102 RepID=A0A094ZEQ5_9PROT|nr:Mobile element protein [Acetobacter tropicalis]